MGTTSGFASVKHAMAATCVLLLSVAACAAPKNSGGALDEASPLHEGEGLPISVTFRSSEGGELSLPDATVRYGGEEVSSQLVDAAGFDLPPDFGFFPVGLIGIEIPAGVPMTVQGADSWQASAGADGEPQVFRELAVRKGIATLPYAPGGYTIKVDARWPEGRVSLEFAILVSESSVASPSVSPYAHDGSPPEQVANLMVSHEETYCPVLQGVYASESGIRGHVDYRVFDGREQFAFASGPTVATGEDSPARIDSDLAPGHPYTWTATAVDENGEASQASEEQPLIIRPPVGENEAC